MKTSALALAVALFASPAFVGAAFAENPMVGGAAMYETKNIVENALNSKDHKTLVAAVKAAGLVDALQGAGPFTVFAPVNAAFDALPAGTVETLLKPENKAMLTKILTAHVVSGHYTTAQMAKKARASKDGYFNMTTLSGDHLSAKMRGESLYIYDESGSAAKVTISDVEQSNGVIQVINKVLLPK